MARFELELSIIVRDDQGQISNETSTFMCFCNNLRDLLEIKETANKVVEDAIDFTEGEVLFGTAEAVIDEKTVLLLQFKDKEQGEDIDQILDLILESDGQTIH